MGDVVCLLPAYSPRATRRRSVWGFRPRAGRSVASGTACLSPVLFGIYNRQAPELDAVRTQLGAPPVRRIERAMLRAPLMLYMTAEPFEYPRSDWPRACAWSAQASGTHRRSAPAWLEELKRPLVLVTCSTEFQNDGKLVGAALEGLAGED